MLPLDYLLVYKCRMTNNQNSALICLSGGDIDARNTLALALQKQLGEQAVIIQTVNERSIRCLNDRPAQALIARTTDVATSLDLLQFKTEAREELDKGKIVIAVSEALARPTAQGDFRNLSELKAKPLAGILLVPKFVTLIGLPKLWQAFPAETELSKFIEYIAAAEKPAEKKIQSRIGADEARSVLGKAESFIPKSQWTHS